MGQDVCNFLTFITFSPNLSKQKENFKFYPDSITKLIAIEPNLEMYPLIDEAKLQNPGLNVEVIPGIAQDLSKLEDNSVDYVVAFHVLCTINDVNEALQEAKRILKRKSPLMIS